METIGELARELLRAEEGPGISGAATRPVKVSVPVTVFAALQQLVKRFGGTVSGLGADVLTAGVWSLWAEVGMSEVFSDEQLAAAVVELVQQQRSSQEEG